MLLIYRLLHEKLPSIKRISYSIVAGSNRICCLQTKEQKAPFQPHYCSKIPSRSRTPNLFEGDRSALRLPSTCPNCPACFLPAGSGEKPPGGPAPALPAGRPAVRERGRAPRPPHTHPPPPEPPPRPATPPFPGSPPSPAPLETRKRSPHTHHLLRGCCPFPPGGPLRHRPAAGSTTGHHRGERPRATPPARAPGG